MHRRVFLTGLAFIAFGSAIFLWKVVGLELPLMPSPPAGLWLVELEVTARGTGVPSSVRATLPPVSPGQVSFGETFSSGDLSLSIRANEDRRLAVWKGPIAGVKKVAYTFRVQLEPVEREISVDRVPPASSELLERYAIGTPGLPADAPAVVAVIEELDLPSGDIPGAARTIFAFIAHEIAARASASDDPLVALSVRAGSVVGAERLLVTLLRAADIPARLVRGLELREDQPRERVWSEVWVGDAWYPISATSDFFGELPRDFLTLGATDAELVDGTSLESLDYRFESIREKLTLGEVATLMVPLNPIVRSFSLHRLPASMQAALRLLLLLPLGALMVAILRNGVGLPSYGTFLPMLIALALRGTGLGLGLVLVALVVGIGVLGRVLIGTLRMLLVPRLAFLLCLVILVVTLLGLLGLGFDQRDFYGGILFPIVILTMLIERFSLTMAEESLGEAVKKVSSSTLIAIVIYPIFRSDVASHVMFSFPELLFVIMGLLVWLGGYMGYRLSDLSRFRPILARETEA
jgi:hypothetical protein